MASNLEDSINSNEEAIDLWDLRITDFEFDSIINQGTTTTIYISKYKKADKSYALKKIIFRAKKEQIKDVVRKYYLLRHIIHPNINPICASFYSDGYLYILTELINGCTLKDILQLTPQIPENILGIISNQILQALQYLRQNLTIHQNLKPSTIFITTQNEIKIDHPNMVDKSLHLFQSIPGPSCYLSPEVLMEESFSYQSDIWSFGLIIFQCVFGQFPIIDLRNPTVSNVWNIIGNRSTDIEVKLPPGYSDELSDFISGCLKLKPDERSNIDILVNHNWIKKINNEENKNAFIAWNKNIQNQISKIKSEIK